jgi:hypothetical protein
MGNQLLGLSRCPHCSIAHPTFTQLWKAKDFVKGARETELILLGRIWAVYVCTTCGDAVLCASGEVRKVNNALVFPHGGVDTVALIFPKAPTVNEELPERAQIYLRQAVESLHAPDGAAVLVASAVDAMLKDKTFTDGSLYSRIKAAVDAHVLTPSMGDWAHRIRLDANDVRHADNENPHRTREEAKQLVDFAIALGQFLYVLPAKVAAGLEASTPAAKE